MPVGILSVVLIFLFFSFFFIFAYFSLSGHLDVVQMR